MIDVRKYGRRHFAVYEEGTLVAVCLYKRGAEAVKARIEALGRQISEHPAPPSDAPTPGTSAAGP